MTSQPVRALAAAALLVGVTGCVQHPQEPVIAPKPTGTATSTTVAPPLAVDLDFSPLPTELRDGSAVGDTSRAGRGGVLRVVGTGSGLRPVDGTSDDDRALQFPEPCGAAAGKDPACPRAIVELEDAAGFNPGVREFRFGATLRMTEQETSKGSNIVQKGFSTGGGSQWKLQVDGDPARPSCVVVGLRDDEVYSAQSSAGVADGRWHDVECWRRAERLSISVDGVERGVARIPPRLQIEPAGPVRLGGKNVKPDNDQFHGDLDAVFLEVALP